MAESQNVSCKGSTLENHGVKMQQIIAEKYIQFTVGEVETETNSLLGNLLLHHAERGDFSFVKGLLESGAPVNVRNRDCLTPLHVSIQKGHDEVFELLLSHRADLAAISRRDICPIYTAAEYNRPQMLQRILELNPNQISQRDSYDSLPIHVAAFKGNLQCLEVLLDSSEDCGINTGNLFGFTPLHFAVHNQQREAVQFLLKRGANPNVENLFGYRPLHLSAVTGDLQILKDLIAGGAQIDPVADNKATPLFLACCLGQEDVAQYLLQKRADGNFGGPRSNTLLHAACSGKHLQIVEMLLASDVKVNSKNENGESPLYISASSGSVAVSKLLIENHCDVDVIGPEGDTPLRSAIRSGREEIVRLLIEAGAKTDIPNSKGETSSDLLKNSYLSDIELKSKGDQCLKDAPRAGESKTGIHNLENTIPYQIPENNSEQPKLNLKKYSQFEKRKLFKAIQKNDFKNFKKIVKSGYDLNFTNEFNSTLLHSVIENRNLIFLKFLLKFNLNINFKDNKGKTVLSLILHDAEFWFKNREEICKGALKKIIELTEDLNVQNEKGDSIFHLIVRYRNLEILDIFTKLKFDMNIENKENKTPFDLVLENIDFWFKNDTEAKFNFHKIIINSLTDVNSRYGRYNRTILHYASECDNVELIHFLFDKGALLNVVNKYGDTPLHLTSYKNCLNASEALINLGADINQKNNGGRQPIHLAAYEGHVPIVDLLIKKGADVNNKDNDGYQPLHSAVWKGRTEVVKLLVDGGAEINGKDNLNRTPLHLATSSNKLEVVEILLNKNADVKAKDTDGKTPLDFIFTDEIRNIYKKFNYL